MADKGLRSIRVYFFIIFNFIICLYLLCSFLRSKKGDKAWLLEEKQEKEKIPWKFKGV